MIISYLLTFVVGFTGNTLVLYVVGRFPVIRRKSVANYYIWNLALADELYVLALPLFCWATYRLVNTEGSIADMGDCPSPIKILRREYLFAPTFTQTTRKSMYLHVKLQ